MGNVVSFFCCSLTLMFFFNSAFCCKDWKCKSHLVNIGKGQVRMFWKWGLGFILLFFFMWMVLRQISSGITSVSETLFVFPFRQLTKTLLSIYITWTYAVVVLALTPGCSSVNPSCAGGVKVYFQCLSAWTKKIWISGILMFRPCFILYIVHSLFYFQLNWDFTCSVHVSLIWINVTVDGAGFLDWGLYHRQLNFKSADMKVSTASKCYFYFLCTKWIN